MDQCRKLGTKICAFPFFSAPLFGSGDGPEQWTDSADTESRKFTRTSWGISFVGCEKLLTQIQGVPSLWEASFQMRWRWAPFNTVTISPIYQIIVSWDYSGTKKATHWASWVFLEHTDSGQKSVTHWGVANFWAAQSNTCSAMSRLPRGQESVRGIKPSSTGQRNQTLKHMTEVLRDFWSSFTWSSSVC